MQPDELCRLIDAQVEAGESADSDNELKAEGAALRQQHKSEMFDARPPQFSDEALALRFTEKHGHNLRYVAVWGKWFSWSKAHWKPDETCLTSNLARKICRVASAEANAQQLRFATAVASAKTVAAVERLARADRQHAATVDQWDRDPWLLNTPGGVIDLRDGTTKPHDPLLYMTKVTAVAPGGECPLWQKFLGEITGGDPELQSFLQRIAGYALTNSIREHALFFLYGTGCNGKSVFLNTITAILGDYAATAPMETFIATQSERHTTDLAGLRGAQLVMAQETERGRRWAESKIKALTGGDPISARFMRQDFFTYTPGFKIFIAGNHKPGLSAVNAAIRRRFHLVPFTVTIAEPDKDLPERLRGEWPGILQWMIDGARQWFETGLIPPPVVQAATESYLCEEDSLAQWIEECCIIGKEHWGNGAELWASWKKWAETNNEEMGSRKAFAEAMATREYAPKKERGKRGYTGISPKQGAHQSS